MYPSLIQDLNLYPVVAVMGARQVGKSTLCREIAQERGMAYRTMDDSDVRRQALEDPEGLLADSGDHGAVLDEVQRAPDLLLAIKAVVDRDGRPGRYLLTGSNQPNVGRAVGDSLLGRAAYRTLRPLTLSELRFDEEHPGWSFLFDEDEAGVLAELERRAEASGAPDWKAVAETGGFPRAVAIATEQRMRLLDDYVTAFVQRDIRAILAVDTADRFESFFRVVAAWIGQELNASGLSNDLGIPVTTIRRWIDAMARSYMIDLIPPYSNNSSQRVIRTPKLYMVDAALAIAAAREPAPTGFHLENLMASDLGVWKGGAPGRTFYHWRLGSGQEVDFVLEEQGHLLPVEVKSNTAVDKKQARHLRTFCERYPGARRGLLLTNDPTVRVIAPGVIAAPWWGVV
jgi:predicted AAA+ superfamily ATPase